MTHLRKLSDGTEGDPEETFALPDGTTVTVGSASPEQLRARAEELDDLAKVMKREAENARREEKRLRRS
jgi:hypothetical protein